MVRLSVVKSNPFCARLKLNQTNKQQSVFFLISKWSWTKPLLHCWNAKFSQLLLVLLVCSCEKTDQDCRNTWSTTVVWKLHKSHDDGLCSDQINLNKHIFPSRYSTSGHWSYSCSLLWPNLCLKICAVLVGWLWLRSDLNKATVSESQPEETHQSPVDISSRVCALAWISRWVAFLSSQEKFSTKCKSHLKIIHSLDGCIWARSEEKTQILSPICPKIRTTYFHASPS